MIDLELLNKKVHEGCVNVQKHPDFDLWIYNYSPIVQYGKLWCDITIQARGLVLDSFGNIVSRPFKKFFNLEEHEVCDIPNCGFDVYEKVDGSLGILYWAGGNPYLCTRGSFISDQAIRANKILYERYSGEFGKFKNGVTYLFEIIYPENRIVVDYGGDEDLILLGAIDNESGNDVDLPAHFNFRVAKKYDGISDLSKLRGLESVNKEGFVVRFNNGFRVKVKFDEYVRLHRIITGCSALVVWEYLSSGRDFNELLDRVPDEFYDWVKKTILDLQGEYDRVEQECKLVYRVFDTRKECADYYLKQRFPSVLFNMLDGRDYSDIIWKAIRPKYSKPFKKEI